MWESQLPGKENDTSFEIHRSKGRLIFDNGDVKMLQGVQEIFELIDAPNGAEEASRQGKIILIGRYVADVDFENSFKQFLG